MKKIFCLLIGLLLILIIPSIIANEDSKLFVSQTLVYDHGKVSFQDSKLIQSLESLNKEEKTGDYTLKVYSFKKEILYETKVNFDLMVYGEPLKEWFDKDGNQIVFPNETGTVILDKYTKVVFVPYFNTINLLKLYDKKGVEMVSKDVSDLAVCNQNSICDNKETEESCYEDCSNSATTYKHLSFWEWIKNLFKSIFR